MLTAHREDKIVIICMYPGNYKENLINPHSEWEILTYSVIDKQTKVSTEYLRTTFVNNG